MEGFISTFIYAGLRTVPYRFLIETAALGGAGDYIISPTNPNEECLARVFDMNCGDVAITINYTDETKCRLIRSILRCWCGAAFSKVITTSGHIYYGSAGIILNEDRYPLLLLTVIPTDHDSIEKVICRISPKVFEHKTRIVEKSIINKIIPQCAGADINSAIVRNNRDSILTVENTKMEVIISDCSSFIKYATPPQSINYNEEINTVALNHLDDIIY